MPLSKIGASEMLSVLSAMDLRLRVMRHYRSATAYREIDVGTLRFSHLRTILFVCATFSATGVLALEPTATSDAGYPLRYVRLYSDDEGVSHFKDKVLLLRAAPSHPASLYGRTQLGIDSGKGATLLQLKSGTVEDWRRAPRRQFLFVVKGATEVTAGDGEKRTLAPGDILLMDDTAGQGHMTKVIGEEDHVALFVPVEGAHKEQFSQVLSNVFANNSLNLMIVAKAITGIAIY